MNNMSCIAMQLQLKNLEQVYGTTLFERGGEGGAGTSQPQNHNLFKLLFLKHHLFTCYPWRFFFYTFLLFLLQNHALFKLLFLENHHMLPWSLFTKLPTKLMEYIM